MKIVTFNLRVDNDYDQTRRFQFRKGLILDKLEAETPDLIGFQECEIGMADFLRRHLSEYDFAGCGRGANYDDENNMVAVLRAKYEILALDTFWLSPTPDLPGSRYEKQSTCPRVCTHVLLLPRGGSPFHFYNTHLDHVSDEARVLGAGAVMARAKLDGKRWPFPLAVTGDMNAHPGSAPIDVFTNDPDLPLRDDTKGVGNTFHDYLRNRTEPQIDYILTRGFPAPASVSCWTDELHGIPLSDHYPVCAQYDL